MAKKSPRKESRTTPAKTKKTVPPSVADLLPEVTPEEEQVAKDRYTQSLIERGEAVPEGKPLPPGATHVITGHDSEGKPVIERRRFYMH